MTDYLTFADTLAIHADLIERYGGSPGLRDAGLLESALFRPQTGYYADLIEEAAAPWESLGQGHAFVDGNKRIAFGALHLSRGLHEAGSFRLEELTTWLRANSGELYIASGY